MKSIRSRAPAASTPAVRRAMQAVHTAHTTPEILLRSSLFKLGLRYRVHTRPEPSLPIKADLVFRSRKLTIFVDGCFWHGCPRHFRIPKVNAAWWEEKIADNVRRDKRNISLLKARGWNVVRIWEHDISPTRLPKILERVVTQTVPKPSIRPHKRYRIE